MQPTPPMFARISSTLLIASALLLLRASFDCARADVLGSDDALQSSVSLSDPPKALWLSQALNQNFSDDLAKQLARVGPNMRASADYQDYKDIGLAESIEAWKLLHQQSDKFARSQVAQFQYQILDLIKKAEVSAPCLSAVQLTLSSAAKLQDWAVRMWSSTGSFPPVGLLDGQFTDLGSYRGCVDTNLPQQLFAELSGWELTKNRKELSSANPPAFTSFCLLSFRPIIPSRPKNHAIFKQEPASLIQEFAREDIFRELWKSAQYFHYLYARTGVCVPAHCSPVDLQNVSKLVGLRLGLQSGPIKCFSRSPAFAALEPNLTEFGRIEDEPVLVPTNRRLSWRQFAAAIPVGVFYALILLATVWHSAEQAFVWSQKPRELLDRAFDDQGESNRPGMGESAGKPASATQNYTGARKLAFNYLSMITNGREFLNSSMRSNEIKCLHGLRVLTMLWIIVVHVMQYNEWSGFTRVFENVYMLQNPILHPIYNANYVVDNFFLMSGLLVAYTSWNSNMGTSVNFSAWNSLLGRYLRLTPQVLLISLLYILLPLNGDGPFWFDMTHYASKYCEKNWWVNLLHLQAFYGEDEICNLVGWWISVDMFYYVFAIAILWLALSNRRVQAFSAGACLVTVCTVITVYKHYTNGYPPNNLGVVPQVAEVWTRYIVNFFWSPFPHAYPFYLGLWIGYVLATNRFRRVVVRWSRVGWTLSTLGFYLVSMSSHLWMTGLLGLCCQWGLTAYSSICGFIWASCFGWLIVACHYGCAPALNRILSVGPFVLLSKASFIIYLSHMLIVRSYFGSQNTLLEVSSLSITFVVIGISFLSTLFGIFLCITFEGPCMKFQRCITGRTKVKRHPTPPPTRAFADSFAKTNGNEAKTAEQTEPLGKLLLKQ